MRHDGTDVPPCQAVSRVHDVLKWANRREVAREVTARGYRLSGETLNRWVRDEQEFPAVVERIVFELFTIGGHEEKPPAWAEGLEARLTETLMANRQVFVETMAAQFARLGVETVLNGQPPPAPDPETPGAAPGPAVKR